MYIYISWATISIYFWYILVLLSSIHFLVRLQVVCINDIDHIISCNLGIPTNIHQVASRWKGTCSDSTIICSVHILTIQLSLLHWNVYIYIHIYIIIYIFLQELSQSCQLFTNLSTKPQIPSGGMWFQIVCKEEISFLRCSNLRPRLPAAKYTCCWIDLYWLEMVQETGNKIHAKKAIRDVPKCWVFQFQWFKHVRTHLKNVI